MDLIQEAKQSFVNALQLNPAHARAASNLGALLTNDGELDEAEQLFLRSIDQSPNYANLRINYARLLSEKATSCCNAVSGCASFGSSSPSCTTTLRML